MTGEKGKDEKDYIRKTAPGESNSRGSIAGQTKTQSAQRADGLKMARVCFV